MIIVRATQKLLNTQRIKPELIDELKTDNTPLGEWYANTITSSFKGKSFVLYVHHSSLICVIVVGKTISKTYLEFTQRLKKLLTRFSFPNNFIAEQLAAFDSNMIGKTNSRKMLGYMNSITDHLIARMYMYQTFEEIDLEEEENILMHYLHGIGKNKYFYPNEYWGKYFLGEDPFAEFANSNKHTNSIQLIPNQNKLSRSENLHMENQLMKLQIEDILGGQIMNGGDTEIPTEIENLFLKNIIEFEKQSKEIKRTTIFELLKKPKFKLLTEMTDKQLKTELNKVLTMLNKKFIQLDFLAEYSNEVKYKFITEEFIHEEAQLLNIPGMVMHFIYEEFHPNTEFEIKSKIQQFLYTLFNPDAEPNSFKYFSTTQFKLNRELISLVELEEKVKYFHLINNTENIRDYKNKAVTFNAEKNKAKITGYLDMKLEGSKAKLKMPIMFFAEIINNEWKISGLELDMLK